MNKINILIKSKPILLLALIGLSIINVSCKKYLDAKTDKKLVIPASIEDAEALLNYYPLMNGAYPSFGIESDDDFIVSDSLFNSFFLSAQKTIIWDKDAATDPISENYWAQLYQRVYNSTLSLEVLDKYGSQNLIKANQVRGSAHFFRAFSFYHLAQYYATPYSKNTANSLPGIPLRLSTDATLKSKRSSLEETWQQIIKDLKISISLLPVQRSDLSKPSKAAAYGMIARVYLDMGNYEFARDYADSSLRLNATLLDYNDIVKGDLFSFERFNKEVLFASISSYNSINEVSNYRIAPDLFLSYEEDDLRKNMFFHGNEGIGFIGSYDGSETPFNGVATDEIYLIKAESNARLGEVSDAMNNLNTLLKQRYLSGTFVDLTANNQKTALNLILKERRKELIMRGSRWFDLRRLNLEPDFSKPIKREINGVEYTLLPGSNRYTFPIPRSVIDLTGIKQNDR